MTPSRQVPLEGVLNLRDIGGYETEDGRRVRRGRVYRSGLTARATDEDRVRLQELGLRRIIDLRSAQERDEEPTRPWHEDLDLTWVEVADATVPDIREEVRSGRMRGAALVSHLVESNRNFVRRSSGQFATVLAYLREAERLPVLIHCSAGKDRTGFAVALLLRLLGVPHETVMADYLLTNEATGLEQRLAQMFGAGEEYRPLFEARAEYLGAAFETIDAEFGDFDRFRREALCVDDAGRECLREHLLD
jgi:protein-tyrosine phosphatase